jgi:4,5-DOPA dioxygenase extradiol
MERKNFLKLLTLIPVAGFAMKLTDLKSLTDPLPTTPEMPVFFFGHGSPMNAIEQNEFTLGWKNSIKNLPKPNAILCISAHWETKGTFVTAMEKPKTIHDFGGFPQALFDVQYPAPGDLALAKDITTSIKKTTVGHDLEWGLDHGTWSVLNVIYPEANIPVLQMSIDYTQSAQYHYDLAKELAALRKKGLLIIGSGNIVHNLGMLAWNEPTKGFDWAMEANTKVKNFITARDHKSLINFRDQGPEFKLAIPTPEHYLPLLYVLALQGEKQNASFFNDKTVMGSIAMTGVQISA